MTKAAEASEPHRVPNNRHSMSTMSSSSLPSTVHSQHRRHLQTPAAPGPQQQQQPSKTVRRHPNAAEPSRAELLKYLACLEGELAARDAAIDSLRQQRQQQLLQQARCGRYGLADPYAALQRDSEITSTAGQPAGAGSSSGSAVGGVETDFDEAALKSMYDSQLAALENLIDTQRRAQQRMREQMSLVERRYRKVCSELDAERRKHEKDAAEGDDVLAGLEKERERLRSEVEFERQQSRKLDRELARVSQALTDERALSERQRRVALALIRDRRALSGRLSAAQTRCQQLERAAAAAEAAEAARLESAALTSRVDAEQRRGRELAAEVERLRALLAAAAHPASQPGGLLKVKPEPPVRRTPPQAGMPTSPGSSTPKQQQQQQQAVKAAGKQQQQQQQINGRGYASPPQFAQSFDICWESRQRESVDAADVACSVAVSVRLPRLGQLPALCWSGFGWLQQVDLDDDDAFANRLRQLADSRADQLLIDCLGANQFELEHLKTRSYEFTGPRIEFAAAGSHRLLLAATVGIDSSDSVLSAAAATGFPPDWLRSQLSVLQRHSCLLLAGPMHCCKRHLAGHLAEAVQREARTSGASVRLLSHDCLDWEAFDGWLAGAGLASLDSMDDDDDVESDEPEVDEISTDSSEIGLANIDGQSAAQQQPQIILLLLNRLEFVLDSPALANLLLHCRRQNSCRRIRQPGSGGGSRCRLMLIGCLGANDFSGVPQSLLQDAVPHASCWSLLSVLESPLTGLPARSLSLRWRQMLAESAADDGKVGELPPLLRWIASLPERCNRCLMTLMRKADSSMSPPALAQPDCPIGPSLFLGCPLALQASILEAQVPVWLASLWNSRLVNIAARSLTASPTGLIADFIQCAIATDCPLPGTLLNNFLSSLIGYHTVQPDSLGLQPDQLGLQPDQLVLQPDQLKLQPDQLGLQPDQLGLQPDSLGLQPDQLKLQPDQLGLQPDQLGLQPDQLGLQPDQLGLQPDQLGLQHVDVQQQIENSPRSAEDDEVGQLNFCRGSRKRPGAPPPLPQVFFNDNWSADFRLAGVTVAPRSKRSLSDHAEGPGQASQTQLVTEVSEGLETLRQLSQQLLGDHTSGRIGGAQSLFRRRNLGFSSESSSPNSASSPLPSSPSPGSGQLYQSAPGSFLSPALANRRRQLFGGVGGGSGSTATASLRRHRHQSYN